MYPGNTSSRHRHDCVAETHISSPSKWSLAVAILDCIGVA